MAFLGIIKRTPKDRSEAPLVVRRSEPPRRYTVGRYLAFTIAEDSLQMAAAGHHGTGVRLLDVRKHYLTENDAARRDQLIRRDIKRYVEEFGGRRPTITVTLAGKETALRLLTLPPLKGADLKAAVAFEAKRQIPFSIDDCWIDFQVIETVSSGSSSQLRAAVLAATRAAVEQLLAPFRDLDIRVDYIYHTHDVVGQLLRSLSDFNSDRDYMLVDIHRRRTEISYYHGSQLQFFHVSSLGSSFLASRSDTTVFEFFAESLATELQNSLDYFGGQFSGQQAHEVFIQGDLAYTEELIELLTDRVGFVFRRFPTERLTVSRPSGSAFESDIPVCLPTVAAAVNQARIADLLPEPMKDRRRLRAVDRVALAVLVLALLLGAGHSLLSYSHLRSARAGLAGLQQQVSEFKASDLFNTCARIRTRMAANQAYLQKAGENRSYLALNLKELSLLAPSGLRLNTAEYLTEDSTCSLTMSGTVTSDDTPPEVILAEFVSNLAGSPFYDNIRVDRHVKRHEGGEFVLDFNLSMKATI